MSFREVLVFVAGATPQIITETIYALAQKNPPIFPDEIHIITTSAGRDQIRENLIGSGIIERMTQECSLPPIPLKSESIIVVKDEEGNELSDIRNSKDNEAVANLITEFIREKAKDLGIRLHCSLAGGRKTMGFYLGSAMQLFGRPWDKLYHVLVTPEFESNPEFFYKPKAERLIECKAEDGSKKVLNTNDAKIELAELPFVRLGNKIKLLGKGFREMIAESQKEIDIAYMQSELAVNVEKREIRIGETVLKLFPVQLLIYLTLLRQKIEKCTHPERSYCFECTDCFLLVTDFAKEDIMEGMERDYTKMYPGTRLKARELIFRWKKATIYDQIRQYLAKVNGALKENFKDSSLLPFYMVSSLRKYGATKYGVKIEKKKIKIT